MLIRAARAETTETLRRLQARGYRDISLQDTNLLANLDTEGTTITALARRAGVTRQAASQQVAALARKGYVTRRADRSDARAVVVRHTAKGRRLLSDALDTVAELEGEYGRTLHDGGMTALKEALSRLLADIDPGGALGRD
jgi:DNA-binding MarR family transcriptional regulator